MAGRSFARRQTEKARSGDAGEDLSPPPRPPKPRPAAAPPSDELEEDFDLDEEYEDDIAEGPEPDPQTAETPSRIYSTRRALAEQVNKDVGQRPYEEEETTGMAAVRDKREAWRKMVQKQEQEGKAPYVLRWAKVSFFPFLYMLISLSLLRKITYEYREYYDYDSIYLMGGFLAGAVLVVAVSVATMLRARRVRRPILLKNRVSWLGVLVFIGASFYLAWLYGLAYAWMFSIGFLAAALLVVALGFLIEKSGKGTFWVKDPVDGSDKRWLEFVPTTEG
jgi:hypothetical protein